MKRKLWKAMNTYFMKGHGIFIVKCSAINICKYFFYPYKYRACWDCFYNLYIDCVEFISKLRKIWSRTWVTIVFVNRKVIAYKKNQNREAQLE